MMQGKQVLTERCADIAMLVLDVDGVLTDGRIVYDDTGREVKFFHVRDGSGLKIWRSLGKRAAIITGRSSRAVEIRAAELQIEPVIQGASDKLATYRELLQAAGSEPHHVSCIGDDLPDLPLLRNRGLALTVAHACATAERSAQ